MVANETAVGSLDRTKRDILGMILTVFWPIQATFVVGGPLCDARLPLLSLRRRI